MTDATQAELGREGIFCPEGEAITDGNGVEVAVISYAPDGRVTQGNHRAAAMRALGVSA